MNFLNIEYFLAAAEEMNFTKAAIRLYISPQSLSMHIARLEEELDTELFNRTHPMTLTYSGRALVRRARELMDIKKQITQELSDIKDSKRGVLSIGISHTRGRVVLPVVLPEYHRRFPEIELKLIEGNTEELDIALCNGEIDLMIGLLPFTYDTIASVKLCTEEILIMIPDAVLMSVFPDNFDEVKKKLGEHVDLELLRECPFLMMHKTNRVRAIADSLFEDCGISPNIILETENIETILALCNKGMGITFFPRTFIFESDSRNLSNISSYRLDHEKTKSTVAVGYPKTRYLTRAAEEFINLLTEVIK